MGDDHGVAGVITASEPSWIVPFTGLSPRCFGKLVNVLLREGADAVRKGRPWSLPLEDRALLVAAYWRTNLTMRQLAPLSGVSKSAADRIIDHLGPVLALRPRRRFAKDTVLIVDGTPVPTRDHAIGVHHTIPGIARMHNLALTGGPAARTTANHPRGDSEIIYGTTLRSGSDAVLRHVTRR